MKIYVSEANKEFNFIKHQCFTNTRTFTINSNEL